MIFSLLLLSSILIPNPSSLTNFAWGLMVQRYGNKVDYSNLTNISWNEMIEDSPEFTKTDDSYQNIDLIPGTYTLQHSRNFDSYLKELGISYILRQMASWAQPEVTITKLPLSLCDNATANSPTDAINKTCGNMIWRMDTDTLVKSHTLQFELGKWGSDTTLDGREVLYRFDLDGLNQLTERQISVPNNTESKRSTITRIFSQDHMNVRLSLNDVVATSQFKRKNETQN